MATPIPDNRAPFTIDDVARVTRGTLSARGAAASGAGITSDSRAARPGSLFVALRGESHDGHAFVERALAQGAAAVVVERGRGVASSNASPIEVDGTRNASVIEVDDTRVAWADLARDHLCAWRAQEGRTVVGITGTAGKTTTKELCAALFSVHDKTVTTAGNLNNLIGVPATIFTIEPEHVHAVIEMGMSLRGEMAELGRVVVPDAAIITNIGVGHAEGVGGARADVAREKGAIYESLATDGLAIANADDDEVMGQLVRAGDRRRVTFGRAGEYALLSRAVSDRGQTLTFASPGAATRTVSIPLPSEAQAIDLLAALAAVESLLREHLAPARIESALHGLSIAGRLAMVALDDGTLLIDDTYNANPESMRAALRALAEAAGKNRRKVAILGEMKELGPIAPMEHEALGDQLADHGVDLAIGCGGLVSRALDRAAARGVSVHSASTTDDARRAAESLVKPGDVVLVKGSRSVGTESVVAGLVKTRGRAKESG